MEIKISQGLPLFSICNKDREVVFVEFPNCISTKTGQSFKWCPTYKELEQIKAALDKIEVESWQKPQEGDEMVDINKYLSGDYINVDTVKGAKDKRCVVISEGSIVLNKWGVEKLEITVQLDTETKIFAMNKETVRNVRDQFGSDTKQWVGKMILLSTAEKDGKRYVVGFPIQ